MSIAGNIAVTGLMAAQTRIDVVAQNLANLKTTAFQKWMVETSDLFYSQVKRAGIVTNNSAGSVSPVGVQIGTGAEVTGVYRLLEQGSLKKTGDPLSIAINGAGYFAINLPNGRTGYTRAGNFQINGTTRAITDPQGNELADGIQIPAGIQLQNVNITQDGTVTATDQNNQLVPIGQINLITFANDRGLENIGGNLLVQTDASGDPTATIPGQDGVGLLSQYYVEESNVNSVTELTDLIDAQRAYEFNSKVLQANNEVQKMAGDIYK
ncbi:MAG: flagellar basal-body rod protein FlgG [Pseudomonadota bacterium]